MQIARHRPDLESYRGETDRSGRTAARETWIEPLERQCQTDLPSKHGGTVKAAAEAAGVNTAALCRLLERRGRHLGRGQATPERQCGHEDDGSRTEWQLYE